MNSPEETQAVHIARVVSLKQVELLNGYYWRHFIIPACPESLRVSQKDSRLQNAFGISGMTPHLSCL